MLERRAIQSIDSVRSVLCVTRLARHARRLFVAKRLRAKAELQAGRLELLCLKFARRERPVQGLSKQGLRDHLFKLGRSQGLSLSERRHRPCARNVPRHLRLVNNRGKAVGLTIMRRDREAQASIEVAKDKTTEEAVDRLSGRS